MATATKKTIRRKPTTKKADNVVEVIEPVIEKKDSRTTKYVLAAFTVLSMLTLYWYRTNSWPVVALVNYRPIFRFQLEKQMFDQIGAETLDSMVVERLIKGDLASRKISVSPVDIDAKISQIKSQLGSEDVYKQALAAQGLTEAKLREQLGIQLGLQQMVAGDSTDSADIQTKVYDYISKIRDGKKVWTVTSEQK